MECGNCTLCCKLLPISWMDSPAGELCTHCDEGKGCKIFTETDDRCKQYSCAYNQMEKASVNMRPDMCKVIFEKMTDTIFHGTLDPDYELNDNVRKQIRMFVSSGFSVIIESIGKRIQIYPAEGINSKDVYNIWKSKVERIWL